MAGVAPKVSVEVCEEGELIRLTVSDNGPGIPPETVYKILNLKIRTSETVAAGWKLMKRREKSIWECSDNGFTPLGGWLRTSWTEV
jgi:hypothetical protein